MEDRSRNHPNDGRRPGRPLNAPGRDAARKLAQATPAAFAVCFALAAGASCAPRNGAAQSADRQSLAEYDIARDLWLRRGQPREALRHALAADDLDDENPEVKHLVALLYLDLCSRNSADCRLQEAERNAVEALELDPEFREARNTLGVTQIHSKRPEEALETLRPLTADMLYRTPEVAWGNIGWALLELNRPQEAIQALERSTAAQPDFCVGHYRLGLALEQAGELERAQKSFTAALTRAEGRCQGLQAAYAARARAHEGLGNVAKAREDRRACVALARETPEGEGCAAKLAEAASQPAPTPSSDGNAPE